MDKQLIKTISSVFIIGNLTTERLAKFSRVIGSTTVIIQDSLNILCRLTHILYVAVRYDSGLF